MYQQPLARVHSERERAQYHTTHTNKQTNKNKVWLCQGSKADSTKHTGVKTPFPSHWNKDIISHEALTSAIWTWPLLHHTRRQPHEVLRFT
jgi:hypothetical protein